MGLSNTNLEQREREEKALTYFIGCCFIGSLGLHAAILLLSNLGLNLTKSEIEPEPIEVVIIDQPKTETLQPKAKQQESLENNSEPLVGIKTRQITANSTNFVRSRSPVARAIVPSEPRRAIAASKLRNIAPQIARDTNRPSVPSRPITKLTNTTPQKQTTPSIAPQPVVSANNRVLTTETKATAQNPISINNSSALTSTRGNQTTLGSEKTQSGSNSKIEGISGIPSVSGNSAKGTGLGTSNERIGQDRTNTGEQTKNTGSLATTPTSANSYRERTENNDSDRHRPGKVTCRQCDKPEYPNSAKRRGVEGRTQVSVDTDENGNVTDVKLTRSSGDSELDEAAIGTAKKWQFNSGGRRQGIQAGVNFQMEGSERSRRSRRSRQGRRDRENTTRNSEERSRQRVEAPKNDRNSEPDVSKQRNLESPPVSNSDGAPKEQQSQN